MYSDTDDSPFRESIVIFSIENEDLVIVQLYFFQWLKF